MDTGPTLSRIFAGSGTAKPSEVWKMRDNSRSAGGRIGTALLRISHNPQTRPPTPRWRSSLLIAFAFAQSLPPIWRPRPSASANGSFRRARPATLPGRRPRGVPLPSYACFPYSSSTQTSPSGLDRGRSRETRSFGSPPSRPIATPSLGFCAASPVGRTAGSASADTWIGAASPLLRASPTLSPRPRR
jgi:hypothetical protein